MNDHFLGVDYGTSGVRAALIDDQGKWAASASRRLPADALRDPERWWAAFGEILGEILTYCPASHIRAIAIDGTSGTIIPVDDTGEAVGPASLYNDHASDTSIALIAANAPIASPARGATSPLGRAMDNMALFAGSRILHHADYLQARLTGQLVSDENNALKTGYDPSLSAWPNWISKLGVDTNRLPRILPAGRFVTKIKQDVAMSLGLDRDTAVLTGTTDGCAGFLATGASKVGDAVTSLGSTLTLKILTDKPVNAPEYGIYSHKIMDKWLVGGASNSGGAVLRHFFSDEALRELSLHINPKEPPKANYYPLLRPGERFPFSDPQKAPVLAPRLSDNVEFLHALFEGIAAIEAEGYARLAELGAGAVRCVITVGGGASNETWTKIRAKHLGVSVLSCPDSDAAVGTARLARWGWMQHGA